VPEQLRLEELRGDRGAVDGDEATKGRWLRLLCWWIARANTSLPVPLSPFNKTVALLSAMRATKS